MSDPAAGHVEANVQRIAELQAEQTGQTTAFEERLAALTGALARPPALIFAAAAVLAWIALNTLAPRLGWRAFDPPPFNLLEVLATVFALFTTLLILATQRREEELARRRSQLTLQLASLSEQKIAKVISMLEEQRRENPMMPDREDPEAEDMSQAADPRHVLNRIIQTQEQQEETG